VPPRRQARLRGAHARRRAADAGVGATDPCARSREGAPWRYVGARACGRAEGAEGAEGAESASRVEIVAEPAAPGQLRVRVAVVGFWVPEEISHLQIAANGTDVPRPPAREPTLCRTSSSCMQLSDSLRRAR
jgi:hypothetical protein